MTISRRAFISTAAVAAVPAIGMLPRVIFAQSLPTGVARVSPSGVTSGASDRMAIQAAINSLEAAGGGVVELEAGTYYLDQRLSIHNRLTIRGNNGRTTEIKPGTSFNDAYLFEFRNEVVVGGVPTQISQFNCRLEDLALRLLGDARITAAVWARSWNEQCGLRNVLIYDYMKHAVLFTDGFGGTATFELRECEFMAADGADTSHPGLLFSTPGSVGYANAILHHAVVTGPSAHADYACIEARNGINLIITGGHVENCDYGIYMVNRSGLSLTGFTGSPTGVVNLIGCSGDFSGKVFGSGVLKAGASGYVLRDNKLGRHISTEQNPLVFP